MSAADEWVQVVDSHNRPCGATRRWRVRRFRMWHRASYIFVLDSSGRLCVQTRTLTKDTWPGAYDLCAGGVVAAGEATHIGARRELAEELGIQGVSLQRCFGLAFDDGNLRVFGDVFLVRYQGDMVLQQSEVAAIGWYDVKQALALDPVTPDSRAALKQLVSDGWLGSGAAG